MKNEIREAYDRMNPSTEAKERMMRNMMKKEKSVRAYGPVQDSYGWWSAVPAMLLLVVILAVGWKVILPGGEIPALTPSTEIPSDTNAIHEIDGSAWDDVPDVYWDILTKYQSAIQDEWNQHQWEINDLNPHILNAVRNVDTLGYSLVDLNSDGEEELLITDGSKIYEMWYRNTEGLFSAMQIAQDGSDKDVHLLQDNYIYSMESNSFGVDYHIWKFAPDGLGMLHLVCCEVVSYISDGKWYAGPNDVDAVQVTEADAQAVLNKYRPAQIPVTRFCSEVTPEKTDSIPQGYAFILDKYTRAHRENWSVEEYMQNDICYVLAIKDSIWEYGYTLTDLTGDGINELIITDGELIYDLYTIMPDGGPGHIISAGERARYYLCEGNIIGYRGSGGAYNTVMEFSRLLAYGDSEIVLYLQFETDTWQKMEGGSSEMVTITEEEAEKIVAGYAPVEIPFQVMVRMDPDQEIHDPVTYADLLRQKIEKHPGVANMFVGLVDVSGDGVSELLLGTADSFGQVYTIENGTVREVFTYGTDEGFHLCADGVIMYHKDSDPYYQYTFVSMHGNAPVTLENICYSQDEGRWYRNIGDRHEPLTDEQKQEIIDSYGTVKLAMIPVSEYLAGE